MQRAQHRMQRGFTLIELLVTMVVMTIAMVTVVLAMPSATTEHAEREESRLLWTVFEAHAAAQRYRTTLAIVRLPRSNGYEVLYVPPALAGEAWALPHDCECSLARLDTSNPAEPLRIEPDALPPRFQWRLDVKDTTRTVEYPSRAP